MIRLARLAPAALAAAALAAAPTPAADVYQIDGAHSLASFSVTHLMISTVRGEFGTMTGTVEYDGQSAGSIKVDATIDVNSITTRNERRDGHLKSPDFFDVAKFPTMTFKSKKVVPGGDKGFKLVGDLTMRGVTKEVTFDVTGPSKVLTDPRGNKRVAASATTTINRQDFGVSWNNPLDGGGVTVSNEVAITVDIEAGIKAAAPASPPPPPPPAGSAKP